MKEKVTGYLRRGRLLAAVMIVQTNTNTNTNKHRVEGKNDRLSQVSKTTARSHDRTNRHNILNIRSDHDRTDKHNILNIR